MKRKTLKSSIACILTAAIIGGGISNSLPGINLLQVAYAEESSDSDFVIEDGVLTKYTGDGGDVVVPEGVTSIGNYAFEDCSSLTSIELPEGVTSIGEWAFSDCSSLTSIEVNEANVSFKSIDGILYSADLTELIRCPEGKEGDINVPEGVTNIGEYAFTDCRSLTSIELPEGVTSIGKWAFSDCSSLTSIEVNEANVSFKSIDGILYSADLTELIRCPEGKEGDINVPEGVTSIGIYAFSSCSSLTSIELPEGVTSIGIYAFSSCSSLTSIELPEGVTDTGWFTFYDCSSLTSIKLPESVTSIGEYTFYDCSSLTSIKLLEGVTSIKDYAFVGCNSLTSIELPESLTSIGAGAFYGCSSMTSIKIPESVTEIATKCFFKCSSLMSIELPEGVTSIGWIAFSGCSSLTSIELPQNVTEIGDYAVGYEYNDAIDDYKAIENFMIYGYSDTAAETYALENGFTFISIDDVVLDYDETVFPEGTPKLTYENITATEEYAQQLKDAGITDYVLYDITLELDGEAVQPQSPVTVSIKVPEEMDGSACSVFRLEEDGNLTDMQAVYEDGYMVFSTSHFSLYVVTEQKVSEEENQEPVKTPTDLSDEENQEPVKTPTDPSDEEDQEPVKTPADPSDEENQEPDKSTIGDTSADTDTSVNDASDNNADSSNTGNDAESPAGQILYGDANGDGIVDTKDMISIKRYSAGWNVSIDEAAADVNGDGAVDTKDAILVNRFVAGWNVTLGK